jgi:hypothetical protein
MTDTTIDEDAAAEAFQDANQHNYPARTDDVATEADNEDDHNEGAIELLPPRQPVNLGVLETLRDHVSAMRDAKFFADGICYTTMVPERFQGKPGDGAAAILFGAELGLSPIAALRSVIVIHGTPGLEARTMKALLMGKGYRFKTHEASTEVYDIEAWSPDGQQSERARWTIDDARRAGYTPKPSGPDSEQRPNVQSDWVTVNRGNNKTSVVGNMKYITDPKAMLKAKATAEVCRDIAPHILLGLPYAAEELEDFDDEPGDMFQEPARPPRRARGVNRLRERAAEAKHPGEVVDAEVEVPGHKDTPAVSDEVLADGGATIAEKMMASPPAAPPEPAPEPVAEPAVKQPAAAAPAPAPTETAGAGLTPGKTGERAGERAAADSDTGTGMPAPAPAPGDTEMSPGIRAKGERLLDALLSEAKLEGDDKLAVIAEIAAKRPGAVYHAVAGPGGLGNAELKDVVDALQEWKGKGKLYDYCGEALNAASLREAGMLGDDA